MIVFFFCMEHFYCLGRLICLFFFCSLFFLCMQFHDTRNRFLYVYSVVCSTFVRKHKLLMLPRVWVLECSTEKNTPRIMMEVLFFFVDFGSKLRTLDINYNHEGSFAFGPTHPGYNIHSIMLNVFCWCYSNACTRCIYTGLRHKRYGQRVVTKKQQNNTKTQQTNTTQICVVRSEQITSCTRT